MNNDLLSLMNKVFRKDKLTISLNSALSTKLDEIQDAITEIYDNQFLDTADWGLSLFEKELGYSSPTKTSDSLRRSTIMAKWRGTGTLTLELLRTTLASYLNADISVTFVDGVIRITFTSTKGVPTDLESIYGVVEDIKPAHLPVEYIFTYNSWGDLKVNIWQDFSKLTWNDLKEGDLSGTNN